VDSAGRFEATLTQPCRVLVTLLKKPSYVPDPERGLERWIDAPAEDVDFVALRVPTAHLAVRVLDLATRRSLEDFTVVCRGGDVGHHQRRAEGGVVGFELAMWRPGWPTPRGSTLTLTLLLPQTDAVVQREIHLLPGERREVELVIPSAGVASGWVVDAAGRPIEGALVFFGDETAGRGDEPFSGFDPARVSGVRSAEDGWFELPGSGSEVSAWHPTFTSKTVLREESARLMLDGRGRIRGRLLDAPGEPIAGAAVRLDKRESVTSAGDGSFVFAAVEGGLRGLQLPDRRRLAVRVEPGEETAVEIDEALDVDVTLTPPPAEVDAGLLIGTGAVSSVTEVKLREGRFLAKSILPGRYCLLTARGPLVEFDVAGPIASAALGRSMLTVRANPGERLGLARPGADLPIRLLASRIGKRVGADGVTVFGPLLPADYLLVGDRGRPLRVVSVIADRVEIDLR
jgi:hypothetical protein